VGGIRRGHGQVGRQGRSRDGRATPRRRSLRQDVRSRLWGVPHSRRRRSRGGRAGHTQGRNLRARACRARVAVESTSAVGILESARLEDWKAVSATARRMTSSAASPAPWPCSSGSAIASPSPSIPQDAWRSTPGCALSELQATLETSPPPQTTPHDLEPDSVSKEAPPEAGPPSRMISVDRAADRRDEIFGSPIAARSVEHLEPLLPVHDVWCDVDD
jgi:hypothetical protein